MFDNRQSTYSIAEIDPNDLELDEEPLGSGFFGVVFRGRLKNENGLENSTLVAVKMIHTLEEQDNPTDLQQLHEAISEETRIMARIGYHENILQVIGSLTMMDKRLCLVTEFCSFKSLDNFLRTKKDNFVDEIVQHFIRTTTRTVFKSELDTSWASLFEQRRALGIVTTSDLLCFAYQIANGMEFVHCREVVHRDLALRNILLTSDFVVRIGDFGLSRRTYRGIYEKRGNPALPSRWTAPEVFFEKALPIESDLWTFGILLWEIFNIGGIPYGQFDAFDEIFNFIVNEGKRLDKPTFAPIEIYELMKSLWNLESNLRLPLKQCKRHLMDKLKSACPPLSCRYEEPDRAVEFEKSNINLRNLQASPKKVESDSSKHAPSAKQCNNVVPDRQEEEKNPPQQLQATSENGTVLPIKKRAILSARRYRPIIIQICAVLILISAAVIFGVVTVFISPKGNFTETNTQTIQPKLHDYSTILLIAVGNSIIQKSLVPGIPETQIITMHDESEFISDIDFDYHKERIVWSTCCSGKDAIWTALLNNSKHKEVIKVKTNGIAVDWSSRNAYYIIDSKGIGVVNLDGKHNKTIFKTEFLTFDVALDLEKRHIYFSSFEKIGRVDLDGRNLIEFVPSDNEMPRGLVMLHERREVCWVAYAGHLSCIEIDDQSTRRLVHSNLTNPGFLTAYDEKLFYWTDFDDRKIYSISIFGTGYSSYEVTGSGDLRGIVAVHEVCERMVNGQSNNSST